MGLFIALYFQLLLKNELFWEPSPSEKKNDAPGAGEAFLELGCREYDSVAPRAARWWFIVQLYALL